MIQFWLKMLHLTCKNTVTWHKNECCFNACHFKHFKLKITPDIVIIDPHVLSWCTNDKKYKATQVLLDILWNMNWKWPMVNTFHLILSSKYNSAVLWHSCSSHPCIIVHSQTSVVTLLAVQVCQPGLLLLESVWNTVFFNSFNWFFLFGIQTLPLLVILCSMSRVCDTLVMSQWHHHWCHVRRDMTNDDYLNERWTIQGAFNGNGSETTQKVPWLITMDILIMDWTPTWDGTHLWPLLCLTWRHGYQTRGIWLPHY